jgi:L-alanine-DL-glutamate epimerase-like enolase superfamily enzyme
VKVTTDQGLEGWGEAFGFRAVSSVKLAVNELIAPFCTSATGLPKFVLCKLLFAMHIAFLELLRETWIVAESTKTKNAFETASGNCARVLDHAAFRKQDRGLKARQAAHKQKRS